MALFTSEEQARIADVVREVEQRTAAEVVVVTVPRCGTYPEVRLAATLALALLSGIAVHMAFRALPVSLVLAVELAVVPVAWLLSGIPFVLRHLLPAQRAQRAVEQSAQIAFLDHAVFQTRDRTGVVILLSELEREVALLGDEGIHGVLHQAGWHELVVQLVDQIHNGRAGEGLCEVIQKLGSILAREAPQKPGDTDELSNEVREMDGSESKKRITKEFE